MSNALTNGWKAAWDLLKCSPKCSHVPSPEWPSLSSWTSRRSTGFPDSVSEVSNPRGPGRSSKTSCGLALEVSEHYCHLILLVKQVNWASPDSRGGGWNRLMHNNAIVWMYGTGKEEWDASHQRIRYHPPLFPCYSRTFFILSQWQETSYTVYKEQMNQISFFCIRMDTNSWESTTGRWRQMPRGTFDAWGIEALPLCTWALEKAFQNVHAVSRRMKSRTSWRDWQILELTNVTMVQFVPLGRVGQNRN